MIRVVSTDPETLETEGILRPTTAALDGSSLASRRLESAAGPRLLERLQQTDDLPSGAAIITPAGDLDCSFLIHAVVQTPEEPVGDATVRRALVNGLRRAQEWGLTSLGLLPFGIGAGNLDAEASAGITAEVLQEHLSIVDTLEEIVIAVSSEYERQAFQTRLARAFGADGVTD
jgi:O-acetyl-ADP-ribose deacetylase (regulator of RNase III)